ncbi:MAG: hypothetical protein QOG58_5939 [Caballeronia sp.]|jgi:hypothetical protein|nr:hypothetical protein [Caballeronia sp.]
MKKDTHPSSKVRAPNGTYPCRPLANDCPAAARSAVVELHRPERTRGASSGTPFQPDRRSARPGLRACRLTPDIDLTLRRLKIGWVVRIHGPFRVVARLFQRRQFIHEQRLLLIAYSRPQSFDSRIEGGILVDATTNTVLTGMQKR